MHILLDILKITLPALIVFLTVYFLLKKFFNAQVMTQQMSINKENQQNAMRIKLQALERLTLFCERIDIPNLLMRLNAPGMTNVGLYNSLLISIQKEFEHNIVQQIYVSEKLWEIIRVTKENVVGVIDTTFATVSPDGNSSELVSALYKSMNELTGNPVRMSINAINREAKTII